jgi:streptomycin 6-kinase
MAALVDGSRESERQLQQQRRCSRRPDTKSNARIQCKVCKICQQIDENDHDSDRDHEPLHHRNVLRVD